MDTVLCFCLDKCSVREYTCIPHVMFVMLPLCRGLCVAECQSRDLGILHFLGYPHLRQSFPDFKRGWGKIFVKPVNCPTSGDL